MIRIVQRITASAVWDIEGTEVRLAYRKELSEMVMAQKIKEYCEILKSRLYEQDNSGLCEAFNFFGGIAFVGIGMSYRDEFLACFTHYANKFAAEWAKGDKCLKSKYIGYEYVFAIMLQNNKKSIRYDFQYILGETTESEQFCLINEQAFAQYWIPVMIPIIKKGHSLAEISKRVGDVRVSKYLTQIPEQTEEYLKIVAFGYTSRRELISLNKMTHFAFGDDSRPNFAGGDKTFRALLQAVTDTEFELQKVKFIAENRKELDLSKDVWVLYQKHGISLKFMTADFTRVERLPLRNELKYFLKNRFSGAIRTSDRTFLSIFDATNRLCTLNNDIRYFSDVDHTDVKNLQFSLENKMDQSQIMTLFSACRILYRYLCSDENESKAPKPDSNPFESIRFVNAKKYHLNTPYIPDTVIATLSEKLEELSETDRLVFKIFSETGMRAKEVAFLEDNCLETARYKEAVKLKYVPYKTLKARRHNRLSEYHSVYISLELADQIRKQSISSQKLRKEHDLPYIFLHQNEGYKASMLNVQYFIKKINNLIKKYNICDESSQLWNFTSRQCRKTLVVNMIENGATATELVYQLGHLNQSTVMQYYAEVKSIKLAELNSEFFRKQFDLLLSKEQLTEFSEEERRLLYVDFRLGNRRVELGFCTRNLCDGACKSRSRTVLCVNCPQLCTGRQYLPYWKKLLQSQKELIQALLDGYQVAGIMDYKGFIEYQQEQRLLAAFQNVVVNIEKSEVNRP